MKVDGISAFLISSGTAICGGSAIAAVSPIVQADRKQMTVALGTVFILNSVALLVFPLLGHLFEMSQHQFGMWAAIAIHDTSSVVGAGAAYGNEALQVATTVKLQRALWIVPLSLGTALVMKSGGKVKIPGSSVSSYSPWSSAATFRNTPRPMAGLHWRPSVASPSPSS